MGLSSPMKDWQSVWCRVRDLPQEEKSAILRDYQASFMGSQKYNHVLLEEALDRYVARSNLSDGVHEYDEAMLAVEIFDEVRGEP